MGIHGFGSSDRNVYRRYGAEAYRKHGTNGRQFDYKDHNPHNLDTNEGFAWFEGWRDAWLEDKGITLEGARALFGESR